MNEAGSGWGPAFSLVRARARSTIGGVTGVIEPASSGRAKCKGCSKAIPKGELRFGEKLPNPYGEGEATAWFHLVCGACDRPEAFAGASRDDDRGLPDADFLAEAVKLGLQHRRLPRLAEVQRSPTGRARCRHCRETIRKDAWRFALQMWEEGRFSPIGFIHVECGPGYFELEPVDHVLERTRRLTPDLSTEDLEELRVLLTPQAGESAGS